MEGEGEREGVGGREREGKGGREREGEGRRERGIGREGGREEELLLYFHTL